jgi:hypothetical protein
MTAALALALDAVLQVAEIRKNWDSDAIWSALKTSGGTGNSAVLCGEKIADRIFLSSAKAELPTDDEIKYAACELADLVRAQKAPTYSVEIGAVVIGLTTFISRLTELRQLTPAVTEGAAH